ncbi:gamma carbonic anhydrase family protein [Clostridium rectalis]|uniref:gamma carbonic anhydrase family protein n=1 Tax=Clostridium rectalis TaxID=2040295 RepID=UPI000F633125|nr:gamma carbonic anhydrase family protein [Clostridium rectalis]
MIYKFKNLQPNIHESCFIAKSSDLIGSVILGENSSVWFGSVIRGDSNNIVVGENTNIQDNCTLHVDSNAELKIGDNVTIGHNVILHGCNIGNCSLIGMGSIILNNARIGENTIVGAKSLVTQDKEIPSGVLCIGSPAKVVRNLTEDEIRNLKYSADHYVQLADMYKNI